MLLGDEGHRLAYNVCIDQPVNVRKTKLQKFMMAEKNKKKNNLTFVCCFVYFSTTQKR